MNSWSYRRRSGVGCDAEIVRDLPDEQWRALLGADRWRLAEQISIETRESPATSRTRAWAAFECLKKAGLPLDSPLQLVSATDDGWVMLSAGSATVATYVAMVREAHAPLAFAVLAGDSRASV